MQLADQSAGQAGRVRGRADGGAAQHECRAEVALGGGQVEVYAQAAAATGIDPEPLAEISDRTIPGPAGAIPIRVYRPDASAPLPVLVYFHGGGWTIGDLDVVHGACTVLTNRASAIVVSVDYRLAPEHPYPAAVHDAWAATRWVTPHCSERVAVGVIARTGGHYRCGLRTCPGWRRVRPAA